MAKQPRTTRPSPSLVSVMEAAPPSPFARLTTPETQQALQRLLDRMAPDVLRSDGGMIYGEQVKYVTWHLPDTADSIELLQVTDVQFGHVCCKYERVLEYRDWVLAAPNRYMLWCGDNIDAWALWSPGSAFDQLGNPQSQVYRFCELWAPARHRILGYVGGNHERRAIPAFGDLGALIATLLRIPYSSGRQFIDLRYGRHQPFKITLWHGTGGAQTKGGIAQKLDRFSQQGDAQLYLMGHLHQPMVIPLWKEYRDESHRRVQVKKSVVAMGSSFLDLWNSYGETKGFAVSDVMMAVAILEKNGRWEVRLR